MLIIDIPPQSSFNEAEDRFIESKAVRVRLEHSLVSISKWEAIHEKPFIPKSAEDQQTQEELFSYISCMIIGEASPITISTLYFKYFDQIRAYIEAPRTATIINRNSNRKGGSGEFVTSELIYYWMIAYNIPPQYEKWHLNRLLTLIDICNVKAEKPKKMSKKDIFRRNKALNEERRRKLNSRG